MAVLDQGGAVILGGHRCTCTLPFRAFPSFSYVVLLVSAFCWSRCLLSLCPLAGARASPPLGQQGPACLGHFACRSRGMPLGGWARDTAVRSPPAMPFLLAESRFTLYYTTIPTRLCCASLNGLVRSAYDLRNPLIPGYALFRSLFYFVPAERDFGHA